MSKNRSLLKTVNKKRINYLYLLPFSIAFFTFTVLPVLYSIFLGFCNYNVLEPPQFTLFNNYTKMFFEDSIFMTALINTLVMAVITGPIGYVISFLLAWLINELNPKVRSLYVLFFYAPSISGNLFMIWKIIFSDDANGYLNSLLLYLGVIDENIYWLSDTKYMMTVCVLATLWMSIGTGFLSFVAGLQGIDRSLLEAGSIDGIRNRWQELWYVVLPSMRPQLLFGAVMSISSAFSIGSVTESLCGMPSTDYAVHTLVNHMTDYGYTRFEMGYASAIATVLFLLMIFCKSLFQKFLQKIGT